MRINVNVIVNLQVQVPPFLIRNNMHFYLSRIKWLRQRRSFSIFRNFRTILLYQFFDPPSTPSRALREDLIYENPKSGRGEFGKNPRKPFPVPAL